MKPPTLIDTLYKIAFHPGTVPGWRSNYAMRRAFENATRFVVDEPMSAFMADLSNELFRHTGKPLARRILDSMRVQSRLPHESVWIEYFSRPYQRRATFLRHDPPIDENELPMREGWLIQQHPTIDTAMILHMFHDSDIPDQHGFEIWTFPFAIAWRTDDGPLPWQVSLQIKLDDRTLPTFSPVLAGMQAYERENVNCVHSSLLEMPDWKKYKRGYEELLLEFTGCLRRVWALLATIDNLPILRHETRTTKGFFAGHRIRKFLSHTTITLNVPLKLDTHVLARKVIAHAHRKRHEVRAHWRDDWKHMPRKTCNPHLWECYGDDADTIECQTCHGRQIYIHKHERGDASLGYVQHSYKVTHEV